MFVIELSRMPRNICFVGDLFAGGTLLDKKPQNRVQSTTYRNADLRIANLEHPIGTGESIPRKSTLHAPPEAIDNLVELDVDAVSLANNHIHDLGAEGIDETIAHLQSAGIDCFGAGKSIQEASEPLRVSDDLVIFGYCAHNSPSLTKIQVATEDSSGINPLQRQSVKADIEGLNSGTRAILFVHWGIENTWVPPRQVVDLAKDLLRLPEVAGIVGSHPHRVQGYLSSGQKRAYFSMGDFLFPDFYIEPPVSVVNERPPETEPTYETKRYHPVTKITRKTWNTPSRISLLISYNPQRGTFDHTPLYQTSSDPSVHELSGKHNDIISRWISFLSHLIEGPSPINQFALGVNYTAYKIWNNFGILLFLYQQNGARWMIDFLSTAVRAKMDPDIDTNDHLYEFFSN